MRRLWPIVFILLSACATLTQAPPSVPADKAHVYIYRRAVPFGPAEMQVYDGQKPLGILTGGSYLNYMADPRTWSTLFYMILKLPLGVIYFSIFVTLFSLGLSLTVSPIEIFFPHYMWISWGPDDVYTLPWIVTPLFSVIGIFILGGLMHIARGIGYVHGHLAKNLLVKAG